MAQFLAFPKATIFEHAILDVVHDSPLPGCDRRKRIHHILDKPISRPMARDRQSRATFYLEVRGDQHPVAPNFRKGAVAVRQRLRSVVGVSGPFAW